MKKKLINVMVIMAMLFGFSSYATSSVPSSSTLPISAKATTLNERLEQINQLDKSMLTQAEKRAMRKEVKSINKELKQLDGGVYLSVGAVIIILLLLIILL